MSVYRDNRRVAFFLRLKLGCLCMCVCFLSLSSPGSGSGGLFPSGSSPVQAGGHANHSSTEGSESVIGEMEHIREDMHEMARKIDELKGLILGQTIDAPDDDAHVPVPPLPEQEGESPARKARAGSMSSPVEGAHGQHHQTPPLPLPATPPPPQHLGQPGNSQKPNKQQHQQHQHEHQNQRHSRQHEQPPMQQYQHSTTNRRVENESASGGASSPTSPMRLQVQQVQTGYIE